LQRVGGSGDGGIDGAVSLDRLGLEKVYVQAKR
jgi:restriction endonuclease Mrr